MKKLTKAQQKDQALGLIAQAVAQVLALKAGIAKDEQGKPVAIEIDAATKQVLAQVLLELGTALETLR